MKTLYLECNMGAAGDMLMAALSELLPDPEQFVKNLNALALPGIKITREPKFSAGIRGVHMRVEIHGNEEASEDILHGSEPGEVPDSALHCGHHHVSLAVIQEMIHGLQVSDKVKLDALAVYGLIAQAESEAHGCVVEEIHFHEVGALDAVLDIVGACLLMEEIGAEKVVCSPVHVGAGMVRCTHGLLPVPAPATAALLRGIPCYGGSIQGELCTPTGAALLKHFVSFFGPMPVMVAEKIGVGIGSKEFPAANILRAFWGTDIPCAAEAKESH